MRSVTEYLKDAAREYPEVVNYLPFGPAPDPFQVCGMPTWFDYASKKLWRTTVEVRSDTNEIALDNDGAVWFPADPSAGRSHDAISSFLSVEGHIAPDCHPVGFIEVWENEAIYVYWHSQFSRIKWDDLICTPTGVSGPDDRGRRWEMTFTPTYAGWARAWPDWLKD